MEGRPTNEGAYSATHQITVINDLPHFRGNPREGEKDWEESIDVRTFFRTLENYYELHGIVDDKKKIRILFSQIDKNKGDAIKFCNVFAETKGSFEEMKTIFLNMYPSFNKTEFKHAEIALKEFQIASRTIFSEMMRLESQTRALVDAYSSSKPMREVGLTMISQIHT